MFEGLLVVLGMAILILVVKLADEKDEYWGKDDGDW
jgi:hypothetical protein